MWMKNYLLRLESLSLSQCARGVFVFSPLIAMDERINEPSMYGCVCTAFRTHKTVRDRADRGRDSIEWVYTCYVVMITWYGICDVGCAEYLIIIRRGLVWYVFTLSWSWGFNSIVRAPARCMIDVFDRAMCVGRVKVSQFRGVDRMVSISQRFVCITNGLLMYTIYALQYLQCLF